MSRAVLWTFFLADVAGVGWCVAVLGREVRRHLTPARHAAHPVVIVLPDDFVPVPAQRRMTASRPALRAVARTG